MDDKIKITDKFGKVYEYDIITTFKWTKTNKYYVVYTDNSKKEDRLQISASTYDPKNPTKLIPIETEEEWKEIDRVLKAGVIENDG